MATDDTELEQEVRDFTDVYSDRVDSEAFSTVLNDAKRHIKLRRSIDEDQVDWYGDPAQEEALNWTTKLFLKVATGELDAQDAQAGAIDAESLLAKNDNEVTVWYRNSERAINSIQLGDTYASFGHRTTERRTYEPDET